MDILKITSPVTVKNKIENISKQLPKDVAFDITNMNITEKKVETKVGAEGEKSKQLLLKNLNKEIYEPLLTSTKAQAEALKKLVLMIKVFESSSGPISQGFLDKLFLKPEQLFSELILKDKNGTVFKGDLFDNLRDLAKLPDQPRLKETIVQILKSFDCYVKQESSLNAILIQSKGLAGKLRNTESKLLNEEIQKLSLNITTNKEDQKQVSTYIKNEFVPNLIKLVKNNRGDQKIHNAVTSIIHNIMRYDSADPSLLDDSILKFGEELSRITNLSHDDILEIKKLAFNHADKAIENLTGDDGDENPLDRMKVEKKEHEMTSLISKALDGSAPAKISGAAQNLMMYMLQSESPMLPLMHFTIPLRFLEENTFGEFFIDKECKDRKGGAKEARNIFFTIQSDKYGNFEVDLLEKDKYIELDIRCPDALMEHIKEFRPRVKDVIEEQGYKLTNYLVGAYKDNYTILDRLNKLGLRKVGVDVKV